MFRVMGCVLLHTLCYTRYTLRGELWDVCNRGVVKPELGGVLQHFVLSVCMCVFGAAVKLVNHKIDAYNLSLIRDLLILGRTGETCQELT